VYFRIKKKFLNLFGGFWVNGIMTGTCWVNYMMSSDPTCQYFWLAVFLDSWWEHTFLEPLIKFLVFLVQKF